MAQTKEGAAKTAAQYYGLTLEEYYRRLKTQKACKYCKIWKDKKEFGKDNSSKDGLTKACFQCRKEKYKLKAKPKPKHLWKKMGPPKMQPRDGDKKQARASVNNEIKWGRLINPNNLPCADCGHMGTDKRHEYDHYLGYQAENHLKVESTCTVCHTKREWERILANRKEFTTINTLPLEHKRIDEFEKYKVGNDGIIKSNWKGEWREKIPDTTKKGYKRVTLYNGNKSKRFFVHRLILECFVGPAPSEKHQGCHIDNNPANNCLQNLIWDTVENNNKRRFK